MNRLAVMSSEAETRRPHTSGEHLFQRVLAAVDAGYVVAHQRTFERGDIVFHEGDPGDSLHLVREGMFAIRSSTPSGAILIVDILAPGDGSVSSRSSRTSGVGRRRSRPCPPVRR